MVGEYARLNTHAKFRKWQDATYTNGVPTEEEWQSLLEEDQEANYGATGLEPEEMVEEGVVQEGVVQGEWQPLEGR